MKSIRLNVNCGMTVMAVAVVVLVATRALLGGVVHEILSQASGGV